MFFGGGGFPFGGGGFEEMRGGPRGPKKEIDNKKFYDLLGVTQKATFDEIKKAFRKLALKHHPDRGGDKETFQELNMAYETLTDPKKRDLYDQYGEDGLKDGGGGGPDMSDLLAGMFGGGGGMGGRGGPR
jgi:DnaJ family protein A protein 2